jgi:hypothetical protein
MDEICTDSYLFATSSNVLEVASPMASDDRLLNATTCFFSRVREK